jgi:hypothetical protein
VNTLDGTEAAVGVVECEAKNGCSGVWWALRSQCFVVFRYVVFLSSVGRWGGNALHESERCSNEDKEMREARGKHF